MHKLVCTVYSIHLFIREGLRLITQVQDRIRWCAMNAMTLDQYSTEDNVSSQHNYLYCGGPARW